MKQREKNIIFTILFSILVSSTAIPASAAVESPKKQMKMGISAENVICKAGLELVIRINGSPACVKPETDKKMQKVGMLFTPIKFTDLNRVKSFQTAENEIETVPASSMSIVNFYITDPDLNLAHSGVDVVPTEGLFEFLINGEIIDGPQNMIETGPNTSTFEVKIKIPREIDGKTIHIGDKYEIRYIDRSTPSGTDEKIIFNGRIG